MYLIKPHKKKMETLKKSKVYINTLMPGFSYINNKGKVVTPEACCIKM